MNKSRGDQVFLASICQNGRHKIYRSFSDNVPSNRRAVLTPNPVLFSVLTPTRGGTLLAPPLWPLDRHDHQILHHQQGQDSALSTLQMSFPRPKPKEYLQRRASPSLPGALVGFGIKCPDYGMLAVSCTCIGTWSTSCYLTNRDANDIDCSKDIHHLLADGTDDVWQN